MCGPSSWDSMPKSWKKVFCPTFLFVIAFIFLVLASVLPLLFTERVFVNNTLVYRYGGNYPAESVDSSYSNMIAKYKDYTVTYKFGVFFYCATTEINYYGSKVYASTGQSQQDPPVVLGTQCDTYSWSDPLSKNHYDFDKYYYTSSAVNGTVIINEIDLPSLPGSQNTPYYPPSYISIYDSDGSSQFLKNVNIHTFNALRVFVIIALIISFVILIKLVVLSILHCIKSPHKKQPKKQLIQWVKLGLWLLLIVWIIILILLLVLYFDTIHHLFEQSKALSIFAIGAAFILFWVGFIFVVAVLIFLRNSKCKHKSKYGPQNPGYPPQHCPPHQYSPHPYPPQYNNYPPMHMMMPGSMQEQEMAVMQPVAGSSTFV